MGEPDPIAPERVVLFDGVCNLCNGSVQFVINHDPTSKFRFAPLQSAYGTTQIQKFGLTPGMMNSVLLVDKSKLYQKSNAALEISRHLSGLWPGFYVFKIVPAFLRNWMYDLIAKNRYRLFGRREECMIPTPELRARFLN